jgi:hypothetical protein
MYFYTHPQIMLDTWRMRHYGWDLQDIWASLRYFGKTGQQLDKYGRNLAAENLPGQGHRTLHNAIQDMMVNIMKVAGIQSHTEAANFLNGKIGEPYISNYINHISEHTNQRSARHAIIPHIHAYNYLSGRQRINDSGASTTDEAFFEIKTMTPCMSRYARPPCLPMISRK